MVMPKWQIPSIRASCLVRLFTAKNCDQNPGKHFWKPQRPAGKQSTPHSWVPIPLPWAGLKPQQQCSGTGRFLPESLQRDWGLGTNPVAPGWPLLSAIIVDFVSSEAWMPRPGRPCDVQGNVLNGKKQTGISVATALDVNLKTIDPLFFPCSFPYELLPQVSWKNVIVWTF